MSVININGLARKLTCKPELPGKPKRFLMIAPNPSPLPEEADLRAWSGLMLDQQQLGACVDFATISMVQRLFIREFMQSGKTHAEALVLAALLSALFLYYYTRAAEGTPPTEDSGSQVGTPLRVLASIGCCDESTWSYDDYQEKFSEEPPASAVSEAAQHKDLLDFDLPDQKSMQRSLADGFSFIVGISVYQGMEAPPAITTGIVPMPGPDDEPLGGHGVEICGYIKINGSLYWVMKNSWSDQVGDKGYFYLPFGYPMFNAKTLRRMSEAVAA